MVFFCAYVVMVVGSGVALQAASASVSFGWVFGDCCCYGELPSSGVLMCSWSSLITKA
ncbi:hypothetical protein L195_g060654, partial [Trifolium pratense]